MDPKKAVGSIVSSLLFASGAALAAPNAIQATVSDLEGQPAQYHEIYGETSSLGKGTSDTNEHGYNLYCRVNGSMLQLLAYDSTTEELVKSSEVSLNSGEEGSFTVSTSNDGSLLFKCHAVENK